MIAERSQWLDHLCYEFPVPEYMQRTIQNADGTVENNEDCLHWNSNDGFDYTHYYLTMTILTFHDLWVISQIYICMYTDIYIRLKQTILFEPN